MSQFNDLCEKFFGKSSFYDILGIDKTASEQQVRKAYHKLSLKVHPDRVPDNEKSEATEKFKILGRIYSVLSNKEKRSLYDITGTVDDEECDSDFDWLSFWKCIFKPLSHKDYENYEKKYKGSVEEELDLKKAYVNGEGDMDFIFEMVPFMRCEDEPRMKEIVRKMIDRGEVEEFDCFFNEDRKKALRRKRKYEKEAREADLIASPVDKDESGEDALRELISARQRERGDMMNNFFDKLAAKYGGDDGKKKTPKAGTKRKRNAK